MLGLWKHETLGDSSPHLIRLLTYMATGTMSGEGTGRHHSLLVCTFTIIALIQTSCETLREVDIRVGANGRPDTENGGRAELCGGTPGARLCTILAT